MQCVASRCSMLSSGWPSSATGAAVVDSPLNGSQIPNPKSIRLLVCTRQSDLGFEIWQPLDVDTKTFSHTDVQLATWGLCEACHGDRMVNSTA